ncbi:hypothetical protein LJY25_12970 [Hymenobacter sp. BT175]|uniref:hypothetical protein n=1 Tax=Hymenobacter translucens TaxID=2886507 RepID=UPI001D0E907F|nr:hypothetical protein [Hymenobacter translucens]MCC2547360.1 hypothetical protein [Hymenobacter translucens]
MSFSPARTGLLAFLLLLLAGAAPPPAGIPPLVLKTTPLPFTPKEFYVADVVDERADKTAVALLLAPPPGPKAPVGAPRPVDFQGGFLPAVRQYARQSLARNTSLRPVVIHVQELRVTETPSPGVPGRVDGRVVVAMRFDWEREGNPVHLVDYRAGARYNRPAGQYAAVEPTIRQALAESLRYLNTWINQEAGRSGKLATGLQVSFRDHTASPEDEDTLFYSPARPLRWSDFRGSPRAGRYAAVVYPNFSYEGRPRVVNGQVVLELVLKTFVVRSSSWVGAGSETPYNLNHEQRHFDLVKLVVERFKQRIRAGTLPVDYYAGLLQAQYLESYREMNHLQDQYETETGHGTNEAAQERWNQRIDAELRQRGLKK